MNIYFLTEEKPKITTLISILNIYKNDFHGKYEITGDIKILPIFNESLFSFTYKLVNVCVENIDNIFIKTVSGGSSFLDYLFFKQEHSPEVGKNNNLIFGVEETKTSGAESRNTNAYQRGTKFIYFKHFYPAVPAYMLYNDELEEADDKKPTDTEIFGTRTLMTLGVKYVGKKMFESYIPFKSLDELITSKNAMSIPPSDSNVPVRLIKNTYQDTIFISGTLSKPKDKGNIAHDPNIGCLSMISAAIRTLGWKGKISITRSGVKQSYIDSSRVTNKFLYICELLKISIDGINLKSYSLPIEYWHYEISSEKVASILFHISCENLGLKEVYQNHAGCERGYFKTLAGKLETLPKYCGNDSSGNVIALKNKNTFAVNKRDLLIPDVIMRDDNSKTIYLMEGKKISTLANGLREIEEYDDIEKLYINRFFPGYVVKHYLTIFGGNLNSLPDTKVLFYLNSNGKVILNEAAEPELIRRLQEIF